MNRIVIALIVSVAASSAIAAEDAAHRADRLRTEQLNRRADAVVERRDRRNADAAARYRDTQADHARRMAAWQRQVAACRSGDHAACDPR